ncbi:MAG: hypothetical protein QM763_09380 [Agriterribacter sp.]
MKKIFYLMMYVVAIATIVMLGCEKRNAPNAGVNESDTSKYSLDIVTDKPVTAGELSIVLPVGTRIQVAKDGYSIDVTLPDGFGFLFKDNTDSLTSMKTLPVRTFGTYTCVCSGKGSNCSVFYQEDAGGFGCIHGSCSGSCSGSFVTTLFQQIYGVINTEDDGITIPKNLPFTPASLMPGAKQLFFEIPEVQKKIADQYDLMYRYIARPDFNKIDPEKQLLRDYVFVRVQVYGVDFYMLGPVEFSKRTDLFEVYTTKASCKCGESSSGCTMGSGGFLGWKVYYCKGNCNGCQLTVSKSLSTEIKLPGNMLPINPVPADFIKRP